MDLIQTWIQDILNPKGVFWSLPIIQRIEQLSSFLIIPPSPQVTNVYTQQNAQTIVQAIQSVSPSSSSSFTVTGFYGPSPVSNLVSVYLTQDVPVKKGMIITGLIGIPGEVYVVDFASNVYGDVVINPGPPSISFPYVDVVTASVMGIGTIPVQPSSLLQLTFSFPSINLSSNAYVFRDALVTGNTFSVYVMNEIQGPTPSHAWTIHGLSQPSVGLFDVTGNVYVNSVTYAPGTSMMLLGTELVEQSYEYVIAAYTDTTQVIATPGSNVLVQFTPPTAVLSPSFYSLYDPKIFDATAVKGQAGYLRDLNSNVLTVTPAPGDAYIQMKNRGFGTGALTALAAIGAQEKYVYGGHSYWIPRIIQHTPFGLSQRYTPALTVGTQKLGQTIQFVIQPRECKDLVSNMHLSCTLPALPGGYTYCELVGRAILSKVEVIIDGVVYESITDDWYIIHDQLFLNADEKLTAYKAYSAGYTEGQSIPATSPIQLLIPLNLFFCRTRRGYKRHFLPTCALSASSIIVQILFNTSTWITNAPSDIDGNAVNISNVRLLLEEVSLCPTDRLYLISTTQTFRIPQVWTEAIQEFTNGQVRVNFTANFKVLMMAWFFRNKRYEQDVQNAPQGLVVPNLSDLRYTYGYTTQYIQATTPITFFNGVKTNFIDVIDYATIYINNQNILSNFPGALYYSYKQPIEQNLSIPTKNIYMYCFSKNPLFLQGAFDFSTLNSSTSHLDIKFLSQYASQITSLYNLHLFHYGYRIIQIQGGTMAYADTVNL